MKKGVLILSCLMIMSLLQWDWSHIKSFVSGAVITAAAIKLGGVWR